MSELRDGDAPSDFHENLWTLGIKDHKDQPVEIAWVLRDSAECSSIRLSLPFQVYILNTAPKTGAYAKLPELLARWMDWVDVFRTSKNCKCHFEIYRTSFINILACVEHQRQEIEHRNSKDGWSRLVEDWAAIRSYSRSCRGCPWNMGFILVSRHYPVHRLDTCEYNADCPALHARSLTETTGLPRVCCRSSSRRLQILRLFPTIRTDVSTLVLTLLRLPLETETRKADEDCSEA